jgi:hypothetical protein
MARQERCTAWIDGVAHDVLAVLDYDEVVLRGDEVRRRVRVAEISGAEVHGDRLCLSTRRGAVELALGAATASAWAERLSRPARSLLDKLGVPPGARVALLGIRETEVDGGLGARAGRVTHGMPEARAACDVILYRVAEAVELERLADLRRRLTADGSVWVVFPRGRRDLQDLHVIAGARRAGLIDNKTVRFSDTDTALRLVIPRDQR